MDDTKVIRTTQEFTEHIVGEFEFVFEQVMESGKVSGPAQARAVTIAGQIAELGTGFRHAMTDPSRGETLRLLDGIAASAFAKTLRQISMNVGDLATVREAVQQGRLELGVQDKLIGQMIPGIHPLRRAVVLLDEAAKFLDKQD